MPCEDLPLELADFLPTSALVQTKKSVRLQPAADVKSEECGRFKG